MLAQLEAEKRARIHALMANGAFRQSEEGISAMNEEVRRTGDHFDEMIENIRNPIPPPDLVNDPFFAAGTRALEKAQYEMTGQTVSQEVAEALP